MYIFQSSFFNQDVIRFRSRVLTGLLYLSLVLSLVSTVQAAVPDWPDLYDPFTMLDLHVELDETDYNAILADLTYDIEVPAFFWAGDEDPILVSIRRKSATAFPDNGSPQKVSFKIDINEYHDEDEFGNDICVPGSPAGAVCVNKWHSVKKLSLENGDDENVLAEGFAWYLQRLASTAMDYTSGYAAWVTLTVHTGGQTIENGVYVNVAQRDKQFLKNHDLWEPADVETWLVKYSGIYSPDFKEAPEDLQGNPIESPTMQLLNFKPFQDCPRKRNSCDDQPNDTDFATILNAEINMESMLTQGAMGAYINGSDDMMAHAKNFYIVDYASSFKREYIPWDLDSTMGGDGGGISIYNRTKGNRGSLYEKLVIGNPTFRGQYNEIMLALLDGILDKDDLVADLDAICSVICSAVDADPHNALGGSATGEIDRLKSYVLNRDADIRAQLPPPPPPPLPETDSLHVSSISGSSASAPRNRWSATATIGVHDFFEGLSNGATVSGNWDNGSSGSCVTSGGTCDVTRNNIKGKDTSTTFTVLNISKSGKWYRSADNHVDTSVTINRP